MDVSRLSPEHQKYITRMARESDRKRKPKTEKPMRYGIAFDSKLEIEFADQLNAFEKMYRIESWMYHPLRVSLAPGCTYTPDFAARVNGEFVIFETKGSWKAKNARDSHTRLVIATQKFPWWIWVAVTKDKLGFCYEVMGPLGQPPTSIGFAQVEASILRLQGTVLPRQATSEGLGVEPGPAFGHRLALAQKKRAEVEG